MNLGADAAEQTVRMTLNGMERIIRVTGDLSRDTARLLLAALRQEAGTPGAVRLSGMLNRESELAVFETDKEGLSRFAKEAGRYGMPFTVLRDRTLDSMPAYVLVREKDAVRAQRILFSQKEIEKKEENTRTDALRWTRRDTQGERRQKPRIMEQIARYESQVKQRVIRRAKAKEERSK